MCWKLWIFLAFAVVLSPSFTPAEAGADNSVPIGPAAPELGESAPLSEERQGRVVSPQELDLASLFTSGAYTYFPLPAFGYSRNESYYVGSLVPILKANKKGEIDDIFAPQYLYNQYVGNSLTMNYYGYRSDTVQYRAIVNYAERVQKNFDFSYKDLGAGGGRYILGGQVNFFKNPFARFFGLGNGSRLDAETDYTARETNLNAYIGLNLSPDFSVIVTGRYRDVRVENGIIPSLPQTNVAFSGSPGLEGAQMTGGKLSFLFDTRDSQLTPTKGAYALFSTEMVSNVQHNDPNRWVRFVLDARRLFQHDGDEKIFLARFMVDGIVRTDNTRGRDIPFYERPTLGGETTLRAFGLNRYINDQLWLLNLEERIRVKSVTIMDHKLEFEVAPNLDLGRVYNLAREPFTLNQTQINPGVGLRVMARPHVVGRLDISYGRDGSNAFVGVDYPF
ncbi:MAG: BamA/TamA family outer membrane protein [Nitrospirota bacterium]|nr:BamA/TamA family outer membrane protein [Nitrospirota bacterium]